MPDPQILIYSLAGATAFFVLLALSIYLRAQGRHAQLSRDITEFATRLEQTENELARSRDQEQLLRRELDATRESSAQLQRREASQAAASAEALRSAEEKIELLKAAREQMKTEFNELANRIFEEKRQRLQTENKASLEGTLAPLKQQLTDFRKRVDEVYDQETRDRVSLRGELENLKKLNEQMSEDAINLTRALKGDKKTQGNWGEVVLERVLEQSGLRKGTEYETQVNLQAEDGGRRMPDVIIRLPDNKDVVVDSKVSLVDYEQYINADDEDERKAYLDRHVSAVASHIAGLSVKAYEKLEGIRSLDFVLLFIPIESAFMAAFDAQPDMFRKAYDKQVIVVSPTTLLATLRTIQTIWRYEHQNRNAEKIAGMAGGIHDQFALVVESLDDLGRSLEKAGESFDTAHKRLSTGRGNLVKRVQDLEKLGARTRKKLPDSVLEDDLPDEVAALPDDTDTYDSQTQENED